MQNVHEKRTNVTTFTSFTLEEESPMPNIITLNFACTPGF